jgi:orotate phosphoribosyltransferase
MALVAQTFASMRLADRERLRQIIAERSLIRGGPFRLASGRTSDYYFDLKPTMLEPEGINLIADTLLESTAAIDAHYIGGYAIGAIPIVVAAVLKSQLTRRPLKGFWVRKEQKDHGTMNLIDGYVPDGQRVIIVDDITTTGGSVMKAVNEVKRHNCEIAIVITIVDRLEGAREVLEREGLNFIALYDVRDFPLS